MPDGRTLRRCYPKGWVVLPLSDTASKEPGSTTIGPFGSNLMAKDYRSSGVPVVFVRDVRDGGFVWNSQVYVTSQKARQLDGHNVEVGDLVATKMGLPPCIAAQYPAWMPRGIVTADILRLRPNTDLADVRWLCRAVNGEDVRSQVAAITGGVTRPKVTLRDFRKLRVPLPPLPEQRRIAEILDTLDEAIRKTEQVIAKLQQMKQGLLHDLLTRGIDENGELRDPERHPEQFKDSPLGRIPRGWEVRSLVEVAEVRSGIAKNTGKAVSNPVMVHYLRVANVQDGYLDLTEMSLLRVSRNDVARYEVRPGDVLMNEGGDLDKLGRGAIWEGQFRPCVHQNHVFVVRCGPDLAPEFLNAWTGAGPARRYFLVVGKQTTNLASINKTALGRLPVVVPGSDEQSAIVSALGQAERRIDHEAMQLTKLRTLKQGLMDDLLSGRVRVAVPETATP